MAKRKDIEAASPEGAPEQASPKKRTADRRIAIDLAGHARSQNRAKV